MLLMKKHHQTLLLLVFLVSFGHLANAQRRDRELERDRPQNRDRDREEDPIESKGLASKLWYGGGVNIGFGAFNGASTFVVGVSPMVGYKIVGPLSAGPRVAIDFTSYKQSGFKSVGLTSVDVGGFVRCRVFRGLFLQGEVSNKWFQDINIYREKISDQRVNQRLGAGWNFGEPGGAGSEISVLYNFRLANDINAWENPIEYRFGFTWRF